MADIEQLIQARDRVRAEFQTIGDMRPGSLQKNLTRYGKLDGTDIPVRKEETGSRPCKTVGEGLARPARPGPPRSPHRGTRQTRRSLPAGGARQGLLPDQPDAHELPPVPGAEPVHLNGGRRRSLQVRDRGPVETRRHALERRRRKRRHRTAPPSTATDSTTSGSEGLAGITGPVQYGRAPIATRLLLDRVVLSERRNQDPLHRSGPSPRRIRICPRMMSPGTGSRQNGREPAFSRNADVLLRYTWHRKIPDSPYQ